MKKSFTDRALDAYFKEEGVQQPAMGLSGEYSAGGRDYVVLANCFDTLAVYRITAAGALKRLRRWPKQLDERVAGDPDDHAVQVCKALKEARDLVDSLGYDHPKAMMAVIRAVDLADPAFMNAALAAEGINLAPTHVDENGEALFSTLAIAEAFDVPHDDVIDRIEEAERAGVEMQIPSSVNRIQ